MKPILYLRFSLLATMSLTAATLLAQSAAKVEPPRAVPTLDAQFVWIAPGSFSMGSPASEPGHRDDETPQTEVTLTKGFWLAALEVTHGQWKRMMGTDVLEQARRGLNNDETFLIGRKEKIPVRDFFSWKKGDDPGQLIGNTDDNLAMIWVSWNEAIEFCRKVTALERAADRVPAGYEYRLPTEAEWEYACRAGTRGATYAGDMVLKDDRSAPVLDDIAVYAANCSVGYTGHRIGTPAWPDKKWGYERGGPQAVGSKRPNAWGLYDMLGGAAEWCMDWNGPLPGGRVSDPIGPPTGEYHVRKGGSWSSLATQTRAAYRNWHEPTYRWINLGFRVALAPVLPATR
jgi:formylglycine-generating enzyme required for sulfatase activity